MKRINISEASKSLADYALELDEEMVVITSEGNPIAAMIPLRNAENVDQESLSLSASRAFLDIIEGARAEIKAGKVLSLDEMKRAVLP
jgi:PHD/YefM family antitoxin component YafN of YafNO toxin-antitoxin module